jgi:hypothetical protein
MDIVKTGGGGGEGGIFKILISILEINDRSIIITIPGSMNI